MKMRSKIAATCPECDLDVRFKKMPHLGKIITCPDCGARLEVTDVAPLELDWATEYQFKDYSFERGNKGKNKKRRKSRKPFEDEWNHYA